MKRAARFLTQLSTAAILFAACGSVVGGEDAVPAVKAAPKEAPKRGPVKETGGVTEDCPVLRPKSGITGPLGIPYRTSSVWGPKQWAERIRPIL